jgi:hypothetical protein
LHTCFISAPLGVDLSEIKNILIKRELEIIDPSEIRNHGQTISEKINKIISQVDIFVAVFSDSINNDNIIFELGIAAAHKKQIIILTPPDFSLPSDLKGFLILKVSHHNIDALGFAIDQFLVATKLSKKKREIIKFKGDRETSKLPNDKIYELINRLNIIEQSNSGYGIEKFVEEILKDSGISVIKQSNKPELTADYAIWSDDLGAVLGNPILIEIKNSIINSDQIIRITNQILKYINNSNSKSAIVFYLTGLPSNDVQKYSKQFNIIFFKLKEFIEQLQNNSFADAITNRRNIIAHEGDA